MGKLCTVSYTVSYYDRTCRHEVELTTESIFEAAVLAINALKLPSSSLHLQSFDIAAKPVVVNHHLTGPQLSAWLAMPGKDAAEQATKARLKELLRGEK